MLVTSNVSLKVYYRILIIYCNMQTKYTNNILVYYYCIPSKYWPIQ